MANQIFANGREVACKAGAGKTIASFPDVCMTPPENPATPPGVPVPYPNTGFTSDTTSGTKSIKISKKEVGIKNKSYFKTSTGNEAGCAAKKGVKSSKIKGKVYFTSWSSDVKFEGKNVVRHLDTTTNNHGSGANEALPWPFIDTAAFSPDEDPCKKDKEKEEKACEEYKPYKKDGLDACKEAKLTGRFTFFKSAATKRTKSANSNECLVARRCRLVSYDAKPRDGVNGCCPSQTPDHIIPKSSFFKKSVKNGELMDGWEGKYKIKKAPCMCLEGGSTSGSHGQRHAYHKAFSSFKKGDYVLFDKEVNHCAKSAKAIAPKCDLNCIEAQLKEGHRKMGGDLSKEIKHSPTGKNFTGKEKDLLIEIKSMRKVKAARR